MSLELDVTAILQPFDGQSRAGNDLRSSDDPNNQYRRIRDTRNAARDREVRDERGDARRDGEASAGELWAEVWEQGVEYLENVAKDLEIAAYMIEASLRVDGVSGFTDALNLTSELLSTFWGEILPTPDEDGIETTLRPLTRLNGDAITFPLQRIAVTEDTSCGRFVCWQCEQARRIQKLMEKNPEDAQRQIERGAASEERLMRAIRESSPGFYAGLMSDLKNAEDALNRLTATIDRLVEEEFRPNLSRFRDGLTEIQSTLTAFAGDRLNKALAEASAAGSSAASARETTSGSVASVAVSARGEMTRESALAQLEDVARWFETHEPQSILPHEIRKVVRRGRMTPLELYRDLIDDENVRRQLFRDVGIVNPDSDSGS